MGRKKQPPRQASNVTPISDAARPDAIVAALAQRADEASQACTQCCTLPLRDFLREYPPAPNYVWGRHSDRLTAELQAATDAVEAGGTYYAIISMPPRHGKSDQASRRAPAWHLLRNPDHEVILATYSADLSEYMSREARRVFTEASPRFGLRLSDDMNQVGAWTIHGHRGGMYAMGLGGTITGKGAHLLIIDDYCKNREEAESEPIRQKIWDSFRSDLMTRLAPAHAVIIVATRWHEDDLAARIFAEMERSAEFPRFKHINFPAQAADGSYLFPERFPAAWYEAQKAAVGAYAWQSLYQGDPQPRTGRMLRSDLVQIVDACPTGLRYVRGWDLASTEKERIKDDPDFTVGTLAAFDGECLWVRDVVRGQWSALERDRRIVETAQRDGPGVTVKIETVAGYKDTFTRIRGLLAGKATVRNMQPQGDKVSRAAALEPLFEAGRLKILQALWNAAWLAECAAFPKGKHDDQVDSLVIAAGEAVSGRRRMKVST